MRLTLAALVALLLVVPATAQWPSFQHDERNSGDLGGSTYSPYKAVWWEQDLAGAGSIDASPVVGSGLLIIADWNKQLRALDLVTGVQKWNVTFPADIRSTPAIAGDFVYAVDGAGNLKQVSLTDGNVFGETKVGPTDAPITIHQGKLYVGDENGIMWALIPQTGRLTVSWKFDISASHDSATVSESGAVTCTASSKHFKAAIQGAAAVHEGRVFFAALNNYVYAVDENPRGDQTTTAQWFYKTGDAILSSPAVDAASDRVIVASYDKKVHAIPTGANPSSNEDCQQAGSPRASWTFSLDDEQGDTRIQGTPAVAGGRVFVGALNGKLYALDGGNGRQQWVFDTGSPIASSPVTANGHLVVANDIGRVVWLSAADGAFENEYEMGSPVKASPALVQDRTYIVGFDGSVTMLGATIPERPDLTIGSLSWNKDTNTVDVAVRNAGLGFTRESATVELRLDGTFLANVEVGALGAGETQTVNHTIDGPPARFLLEAIVDPNNVIAETDEDNNSAEHQEGPPPAATPTGEPTPDPGDAPPETDDGGGIEIPAPALAGLLLGILALAVGRRRR